MSEVTTVIIWYIHPSPHGHRKVNVIVMNGRLTSLLYHVDCPPIPEMRFKVKISGPHLIVQTSKFFSINATAMILGQGHEKVTQYISSDPYFLCAKYLRLSTNSFEVRGKRFCGGGHTGRN